MEDNGKSEEGKRKEKVDKNDKQKNIDRKIEW